jgi:hypothetical protein
MANFKVITDVEGSYDMYADESKYSFNDAHLLVVVRPDGMKRTYSPNGWRFLEEDAPTPSAPKRIR